MIKLFEQFNNEQEIHDICEKYGIEDYTINKDGSIDINKSVFFDADSIINVPLIVNVIDGSFDCSSKQLTTLEGCPKYINGFFDCSKNNLTSLKGMPKCIGTLYLKRNPINKIDVECDVKFDIFLDKTNLDQKIKDLDQHYLRMLFKHGLDYKIFNDDGSINDKQLEHFLNDFKE